MTAVLRVEDLRVHYHTPRGAVKAVDGVTFRPPSRRAPRAGRRVGLRQVDDRAGLMRMIKPPGRIEGGDVLLDGDDLLGLSDEQMRQRRLAVIAMVAQGAMNSLNPVIRVRDQIVDALRDHGLQPLRQRSLRRRSPTCSSASACGRAWPTCTRTS